MQVLSVTPLDKRRSKVLVDEGFAFVLYKGELRKYQIQQDMELSEQVYKEILEEILKKRARERALYLLKTSDKTEEEIRRKLREGYYPQEAIDSTMTFLREYHLIDDADYARRYVRTYGSRRSKKRIQFDLMQKGLDKHQIGQLLEEEEISEDAQIEAFLRRKGYWTQTAQKDEGGSEAERAIAREKDQKERSRLIMALSRKGFSYEAIYRVMGCGEVWD